MSRLASIARAAAPPDGVQFRPGPYGTKGVRRFLRDVIALANAPVEGPRYIVVGVEIDAKGARRLTSVGRSDFSGSPAYAELVTDYIEPQVRVTYEAVDVDGKRLGVFEIADCRERPYMMRVDHSEKLRRGDAYIRIGDAAVKMGRRQLQEMFEGIFRASVSADQIEVGFPGEIILKKLSLPTVDVATIPSAVARAKINELLTIQSKSKNTGSTTGLIRLAHARLFGCDDPYETWTPARLMEEMTNIESKHHLDDQHFLFEEKAHRLQIVVYNQGEETIRDAALSMALPVHNAFYVADRLPKIRRNGEYADRHAEEQTAYPKVSLKDGAIHVLASIGDVPAGAPVEAFDAPLRICAGSDLKGRRLGLQYCLSGRNLRVPVKGKLRLQF